MSTQKFATATLITQEQAEEELGRSITEAMQKAKDALHATREPKDLVKLEVPSSLKIDFKRISESLIKDINHAYLTETYVKDLELGTRKKPQGTTHYLYHTPALLSRLRDAGLLPEGYRLARAENSLGMAR